MANITKPFYVAAVATLIIAITGALALGCAKATSDTPAANDGSNDKFIELELTSIEAAKDDGSIAKVSLSAELATGETGTTQAISSSMLALSSESIDISPDGEITIQVDVDEGDRSDLLSGAANDTMRAKLFFKSIEALCSSEASIEGEAYQVTNGTYADWKDLRNTITATLTLTKL